MVWLVLAAQEAPPFDRCRVDSLLDLALLHQIQKCRLVDTPVSLVLFVGVQNVSSRREQWLMDVIDTNDLFEKVLEIVLLGKSSELGNIIEPHIHHAFGAALAQHLKELGGGLLGKTNSVNSRVSIHRLRVSLSALRFVIRQCS